MSPRRHHYDTYDTETPPGYSYICDGTGAIIRNDDGERVYEYMHRVTWNIFRYDLLTTWPNIPRERKDYVISLIKDEFPQPSRADEFNAQLLLEEMGQLMGHHRSEARDAYKDKKPQPPWCDDDIVGYLCMGGNTP